MRHGDAGILTTNYTIQKPYGADARQMQRRPVMLRLTKRVKYAERFDVAVIARWHVGALPSMMDLRNRWGYTSRRVSLR